MYTMATHRSAIFILLLVAISNVINGELSSITPSLLQISAQLSDIIEVSNRMENATGLIVTQLQNNNMLLESLVEQQNVQTHLLTAMVKLLQSHDQTLE